MSDLNEIPLIIPEHIKWEILTLDDIKSPEKRSVISGPFGSNISSKYFVNSGIPVIRGNNLSNDIGVKFKDSGFVFITLEKADELNSWAIKDDLIFTAAGTIGQVGILTGKEKHDKYVISNKQLRVRLNKSIVNPSFAYYWFASPAIVDLIIQRDTGSTIPLINLGVLKSLPILLPPLPEQQAIAEVLSSLDDKIDLLHRNNKTLEEMAETLFRQWFVEGAKEDWEDGCINDLLNIKSGYAFKSSSFTETGLYKLITIKNVQDGFLDLSKVDYLSSVPHKTPDYCILKEGDILLSLTGNVGRCCLVDSKNLLLNQRVAKLVAKNPLDTGFVYTYFRLNTTRKYLEEISKGTAQANLSPIETGKINIQLPPRELLNSYSLVVTPLLNKLLFNRKQINRLEMTRDTLLPKLMSGQVRVIS
jgi:type I restriction enzyme S subunit